MSNMCQIKASAGSGKTYTLTRRYLQLMKKYFVGGKERARHLACYPGRMSVSGDASDILAITFTNAAVNEIRARIITHLKKTALGLMKTDDMKEDEARICLEALLDNMDSMNVRTIDSLLHQLVRASALSLRLNPEFEPTFMVPDAFETYLDQYMCEAFLGDEEKLETIREAVGKFLQYAELQDNKAIPLLTGKPLAEELSNFLEDALIHQDDQPYAEFETVKNAMELYRQEAMKHASSLREKWENRVPEPGKKLIPLSAGGQRFIDNIAAGQMSIKEKIEFKDGFLSLLKPSTRSKVDPRPFENEFEALLRNYKAYKGCEEHLKYARIQELAATLVDNFIKDLPHAKTLPSVLIPILAKKALSIEDGVCDSLCRLGSRLSHFMIDEFQDTSLEQWGGIHPLLEEALSKNGSLTWVGDIKQSIFMWRNACPDLFDGILKDNSLTCMVDEVEKAALPFNRRSAAKIVEFNNRLFGNLNRPEYVKIVLSALASDNAIGEEVIEKISVAFAESIQKMPSDIDPAGFVSITGLPHKKAAEFWEDFKDGLLHFLKVRLGPSSQIRASDILILVRKNKDATSLAEALAANGIPVVTQNSLLLSGETLIEEAIALLEFMEDPLNDAALQTVLCGEAFLGLSETDCIIPDDMYRMALKKGDSSLLQIFQKEYPELWEKIIQPFQLQSTLMPPYDVIKEWFRRTDLERRFPERQLFLESFLEYAHGAEGKGYASIPEFLEKWHTHGINSMAAMPEGIEAVRIMTIHKAKGLQAPIVFVPIPDEGLRLKGSHLGKRIRKKIDNLVLNVPLQKIFYEDYALQIAREARETLNMLYVAFTRAEKELHIYTSITEDDDKECFIAHLLHSAGLDFPFQCGKPWSGNEFDTIDLPNVSVDEMEREEDPVTAFPWISRLKIARNTLFSGGDYAERRGTFIHFCLENLHLTGDPEKDARDALNFGLSHSGIELDKKDLEDIYDGLLWFISQKGCQTWLANGWTEQAMIDKNGTEYRVDLLVPTIWGALIVDYKSGQISDEHISQMRSYLKCLEESGEFGNTLCAMLVYMDQKKFLPVSLAETGHASDICPKMPFGQK